MTDRSWTAAQLAAITHEGGDLLVSAAAGSGKTAVLAERCARLVCGDEAGERCGIENLLVLTFTEAAAGEMRTRIAAALAQKLAGTSRDQAWLRRQAAMVDRAAISTLHAFCARILRQHFHEAGVDPAFEVMDQDEARLLQGEVMETLLALWHGLPAGGKGEGVTAEGFETFFEAYAQGNEAACGKMVLDVHRMLVTIENPQHFMDTARRAFGAEAPATVERYSSETLTQQIQLVRLQLQRAIEEVRALPDAEKMVDGLAQALTLLDDTVQTLRDKGTAAWPAVAEVLRTKWPILKTIASLSDFAALKKRAWDDIKDAFKELANRFDHDPGRMVADLKSLAAPLETLLAMVAEFEKEYSAAKREENRLDFADLERFALELLTAGNNLAAVELRQRYRHILVDEFQDINPLQAALLQAVRHPAAFDGRGNLFVVGDVKQSIYGFRLADPDLFLEREKAAVAADAAGIAEKSQRHVALQENFRSQPRLLDVMNAIFERLLTPEVAGVDYARGHALKAGVPAIDASSGIFNGIPVEVHLVSKDGGGAPQETEEDGQAAEPDDVSDPHLGPSKADEESASAMEIEARLVAARIAELIHEGKTFRQKDGSLRKIAYRNIAVLMRSARSRGMIFARALADRGIPVHADLQAGFFDTPEVQNAVALLQVLDNQRQDIPLATVLLSPFGGFSHDDLSIVRLTFDRKEVAFAEAVEIYPSSNGGVPYVSQNAPPFSSDLAARLAGFFAKLAHWREKLCGRPLHEGLADILAQSGIFTYLAARDAGRQRVANLQMLHQRALAFASFRKQGLHRFLRFIEKLRQQEEADGGEAPILSEASDVVRIMTIHKSKGLEFPVVFVCGLGSQLRLTSDGPILLHRDLGVGLSVVDLENNIHYPSAASLRIREEQRRALRAEELRLLYVAITRARDALFLTGHLRKAGEIETWRKAWKGYAGPLPEDILLKGRRALDWLMPALAMASGPRLSVAWQEAGGNAEIASKSTAQVIVTLHGDAESATRPDARAPSADAARILAGLPLSDAPDESHIAALVQRVTGTYSFEKLAQRPAVQTVSFLKTLAEDRDAAEEAVPISGVHEEWDADARADDATRPAQADAARLRGLATHRVLELLDLANCGTPQELDEQLAGLLKANLLTQPEADRADWPGIRWFLWHSATGARLAAAAREAAGSARSTQQLRRELPFAWIGTLDSSPDDAQDLPTIRGVIDVLLVDLAGKRAEIVDYKTDSARLWESRVEDYRRQMHYYMAAASDILRFKVEKATLVFLAAQREIEVSSGFSVRL